MKIAAGAADRRTLGLGRPKVSKDRRVRELTRPQPEQLTGPRRKRREPALDKEG